MSEDICLKIVFWKVFDERKKKSMKRLRKSWYLYSFELLKGFFLLEDFKSESRLLIILHNEIQSRNASKQGSYNSRSSTCQILRKNVKKKKGNEINVKISDISLIQNKAKYTFEIVFTSHQIYFLLLTWIGHRNRGFCKHK